MRNELLEPGADRKCLTLSADGRMYAVPQAVKSIKVLRKVVESALAHRHTRVCVIDEAFHLLRFEKEVDVMETLKSLSNQTQTKFVLVGSFDLYDLVAAQDQVVRRASILSMERYHLDDARDRAEFKVVVGKLQAKWPCVEVPNFVAISDELMEAALGCVGLLKSLLLDALVMQLNARGKWKGQFLQKAAKANALRSVIAKEIELGEAKVRDALYGNSLWDAKALAKMELRMEAACV